MGNELSGLVPSFDGEEKLNAGNLPSSFHAMSFGGNAEAMQSFDERGAGRRVAMNLAAEDDGKYAYIEEDYADPTDDRGEQEGGETYEQQRPAGASRQQHEPEEEAPKRYTWKEIPDVTLPIENETLFVRRAPPGACLQRKTKRIVDQFTSKEEVFELQGQEQQRALEMQRKAIEKVLLSKHSHQTKKGRDEHRLQGAIRDARQTASNVHEYTTYSNALFVGHEEYVRNRQTGS